MATDPPKSDPPKFPMFVLPIAEALALDAVPQHEDIKDKLVEWQPSMGGVAFFSHTWLGFKHPDPEGVKWALLKTLLIRILNGALEVRPHWSVEFLYGKNLRIKAETLRSSLTGGYIWFE